MFNIGLSGAQANQLAMNVTASNTANATNTDYNRQIADMSSVLNGNVVAGVGVDSIRRVTDVALTNQVRIGTEAYSYSATLSSGLSAVENLLGIESLSVNDGMSQLIATFSEASVNPESTVYRTQILTAAKDISERFNQISSQLNSQIDNAQVQQKAATEDANAMIASIADLNQRIKEANAGGENTNSLQDSMDAKLKDLSEKMNFNVLNKADGTVELSTENGSPVVSGNSYGQLYTGYYTGDSDDYSIGLSFQGQSFDATGNIGGTIGANIDLIEDHINPVLDELDGIAAALADNINNSLMSGLDLKGNDGVALFDYDPSSPASSLNITDISTEEIALASKPTGYNPATDSGNYVGNGDIATLISGLGTEKITVNGKSQTLFDNYSDVLGTVGLNVKQAANSVSSTYEQLNQAMTSKSNLSGVNSDEEAVNLITYMNAYEANMKIIQTAKSMFDSVLNAF